MYEVWNINSSYLYHDVFDSLEDAILYGRSKGFEFSVFFDGDLISSYTGVTLSRKGI